MGSGAIVPACWGPIGDRASQIARNTKVKILVGWLADLHGKKHMVDQTLSWLLEDNQPAVRYRTLTDLMNLPESDPEVMIARSAVPKRGWAADILGRQKPGGHWESSRSLYRPKYTATNWMALVLSDLGLTREDPRIAKTAELFFDEWMDDEKENIFKDEVCIVGNAARFMTRFGYYDDPRVRRLFDRLLEDQKEDGGWHCWDSAKGTLDCWEALAAFAAIPKRKRTRKVKGSVERGIEFYLERKLFEEGRSKYLPWFRLHYPVHYYYDILVGLDVVTALGFGGDERLKPSLEILNRKRHNGRWPLERVHPDPQSYAWGKHNRRQRTIPFALEKVGGPSKWLTLTALKVQKKVAEAQ